MAGTSTVGASAVATAWLLSSQNSTSNYAAKINFSDPMSRLPIRDSGKTSGILVAGESEIQLESGWNGPAIQMPPKSSGFNIVTRTHVEGHAAALMNQNNWRNGTLYINNPPCSSCNTL